MQDLNNEEKLEYYKIHFDKKTKITKEKSILDLRELSTMIKQLNSYIDGNLDLSLEKIGLGRLNKVKEAIYYASIETDATPIDNISLSEINALEAEYINILSSTVKKSLKVMHIGAFDLLVRNQPLPGWIDSFYKTAFDMFRDNCKKKNLEYLFDSYIICNAFLADVLKRKGSDRLYDVSSAIAKKLLDYENTDAIVYESVQVKDAPVIAIKTDIVDSHIEHNQITCFKIENSLGYGLYYGETISKALIKNNDNKLVWEKSHNE